MKLMLKAVAVTGSSWTCIITTNRKVVIWGMYLSKTGYVFINSHYILYIIFSKILLFCGVLGLHTVI
jgi:hypothetical protein